ncbi:MAG: cobalamin B12-binding domain-containing protein [Mycolicibacterium cosmeticum]|nr:cobalamin B12-binding domain-containing protein [Mycolicibacterium cosmeticum]
MDNQTLRVLLTKSFIDSHDRAIKTVAAALRDAAMEVVLIDYETPQDVIDVAIDEDVDVVGLSFMSGGQVDVTTQVVEGLRAKGAHDVPVVVGGTIRPFDVDPLVAVGVAAIFRGGETLASIAETFARFAAQRKSRIDD